MNHGARHGLAYTGEIPAELDGVFVAIERTGVSAADTALQASALRIAGGAASWDHASTLASLLEHLRADAPSLNLERQLRLATPHTGEPLAPQAHWSRHALGGARFVSRASEVGELEWRSLAPSGATHDGGAVCVEPPLPIVDVAFTERALVVIAHASRAVKSATDRDEHFRVGSAPLARHATLRWSSELRGASAAFLHVCDAEDAVIADIRSSSHARAGWASLERHHLSEREQPAELLYQGPLSAPLMHATRDGGPARFVYGLLGTERDGDALARVDLISGELRTASFGFARQVAPPALIVPPASAPEHGYLATCVYDAVRDQSALVLLRAESIDAPPLATIPLPEPLRPSLPGLWLPTRG